MRKYLVGIAVGMLASMAVLNMEMPSKKDEVRHIWMDNIIKDDASYTGLAKSLQGFKGHLYVHLVGPGGDYSGVQYLTNLFRSLPDVTMVVEGTVQSGHAMLALMGTQIIIPDKGLFMLHLVGGTGSEAEVCAEDAGKLDRGINAQVKCEVNFRTEMSIYNREILDMASKFLTPKEMDRLKSGWEVYIQDVELKKRLLDMQVPDAGQIGGQIHKGNK